MQMDVNPAGEVYSILRDNPIPLVISSVAPCQGTDTVLKTKLFK
jgi:hypothetical protein